MSDVRALAAGIICCGFEGLSIDGALERRLKRLPPAGILLFGRNIATLAQTRTLTDRIRAIVPSPIIAIDQEGGRVVRLRDGVEQIPSMMALAAAGDEDLAQRAGEQMACDLRRAGLNLDFAPVLDLALERMNTVIGTRSFGDDPERVASLGGAFARGLRRGGMAATYKHFPGHGSTEIDSHLDLPVIDVDEAILRERDLLPFTRLLPQAEAVMTAHIVARKFDPNRPATLSRRILTTLLREELHFDGVCFTDCLEMDAIAKGVGSEAAGVQALAAGADCLLVSHDPDLPEGIVAAIERAVADGSLAEQRLTEAHRRVQALRNRLQPALALVTPGPHKGIGEEIGRRAVTVIRGDAHAEAAQSIVVSFESTTTEGVQGIHSEHASLTMFAPLDEARLPLKPSEADVRELPRRVAGKRPIVLMRRAHVYSEQKAAIDRIVAAEPQTILVSAREPFDAFDFPEAANVLCTYGDDAPSIAGLAAVLFRGERARGVFPIRGLAVAGG